MKVKYSSLAVLDSRSRMRKNFHVRF